MVRESTSGPIIVKSRQIMLATYLCRICYARLYFISLLSGSLCSGWHRQFYCQQIANNSMRAVCIKPGVCAL